jgi:hypothetical protein
MHGRTPSGAQMPADQKTQPNELQVPEKRDQITDVGQAQGQYTPESGEHAKARRQFMKRFEGISPQWFMLLLIFVAPMATTQITSARLSGYVFDSSGRRLQGVGISVKNIGTNLTQTVRSLRSGEYSFSALPPGQYTLMTSIAGFPQYSVKSVILTVGQSETMDIMLKAGNAQGAAIGSGVKLADSATAEISDLVDKNAIKDLPLNGHDPSGLVYLSAGVSEETISQAVFPITFPQSNQSFSTESGASAGGGRQGSTWYLLDGVPNMDTTTLLAAPFPNADTTQEFRVITGNLDARYGFAPGAVVNITTKSGSNDFHGGIFEFVRNYDADAKLYFFSGESDSLRRNQFGGFAGGPILKDKLFIFGNYQETRNNYSPPIAMNTPTADMLQGDFSGVKYADGTSIPLHGPSGTQYPFQTINGKPNQMSPALFSKGAVALDKLIPNSDPVSGQVSIPQPAQQTNYNEGTGRVDFVPNNSQRMFLRLFADALDQPGAFVANDLLSGVLGQHGLYINAAFNHVWTISPVFLNSITAAYISYDLDSGTSVRDQSGNPVCLSQFINVSDPPGQCYINLGVTSSNIYDNGDGFGVFSGQPYRTDRRDWTLNDILTRSIGKHTVAAGADTMYRHYYEFNSGAVNPAVSFDGSYTGYIQSDFLMGFSTGISQQGTDEAGTTSGWMLGIYLQDQFRLLPSFTISAGLRWDPNLSPAIAGNRGAAFVPGAQSTRFPNAPKGLLFAGEQGVPSGLIKTTYGYFEPRIGIAWAATPKISVRAGYGIFSTPLEDAFYNRVWDASPFSQSYSVPSPSAIPDPFDDPWSLNTATGGKNPFPPFLAAGSTPATNSAFPTPTNLPAVFASGFKLGMTESWNLSIEQQFLQSVAIHVAYVGSESYHQAMAVDKNPGQFNNKRRVDPDFGVILQVRDGGTANYHSLQVGFEKQLSHRLQAQSSFTWSKTFDLSFSGDPSFGFGVSDPTNPSHDHGLSALNFPFIWVSNFIYGAPEFKTQRAMVRNAIGGWKLSGIYTASSGPSFTVNGGGGNNNSGLDQFQDRADVVPGVPLNIRKGGRSNWLNQYMNPKAFQENAFGTPGNVPKYNIQQPPLQDVDLALLKDFAYHENRNIEFRFEAFNALNHPSFAQPVAEFGDPNFGKINKAGPINPRVLQAALKLTF